MLLNIAGNDNKSKVIFDSSNSHIINKKTLLNNAIYDWKYFINVSKNNETKSITSDLSTSLNWPNNKGTNMHYSTLGLNRPNEKKTIMLNTDKTTPYTIHWSEILTDGKFTINKNLYNNEYFKSIDMKKENSLYVDPSKIHSVVNTVVTTDDELYNVSAYDNLTVTYNIADEDKHPLYDYFSNFSRSSLKTMNEEELNLVKDNVNIVYNIFKGYYDKSISNTKTTMIGNHKVITNKCKKNYSSSLSLNEIKALPSNRIIDVDINRQLLYNKIPKMIHKILGTTRSMNIELKNKLGSKDKKFVNQSNESSANKNLNKSSANKNLNKSSVNKNLNKSSANKNLNKSLMEIGNYEHLQTLAPATKTSPLDPCTASNGEYIVSIRNATEMYIYDMSLKLLEGPIITTTLFSPNSGGGGDPIIMYDTFDNKWVVIEFGYENAMCIATTKTSSPLTAVAGNWENWNITCEYFPDYPKFGIYKNHYAISTNEYNNDQESSPSTYIINKSELTSDITQDIEVIKVIWDPVEYMGFQIATPVSTTYTMDTEKLLFVRHRDDSRIDIENDSIEFLSINVSELSQEPIPDSAITTKKITIPEFSSDINGYVTFDGVECMNGGSLDAQREVIMNFPELRKIGDDVFIGMAWTVQEANPITKTLYAGLGMKDSWSLDVSSNLNETIDGISNPFNDLIYDPTAENSPVPNWGFARCELEENTEYQFNFNAKSYPDEIRFKVCNDDGTFNSIDPSLEKLTNSTSSIITLIHTGDEDISGSVKVSTNLFIFVGDSFGDSWNGSDIKIHKKDSPADEVIFDDITNDINAAEPFLQKESGIVKTEIMWNVLSYNMNSSSNEWTLFKSGRISDRIDRKSYFCPSVNIDDNGFISIICSGTSKTDPVSIYFTRKYLFDETEFPESIMLSEGKGGVNTNRWGDYFSLVSPSPNIVVGIGVVSGDGYREFPTKTTMITQKLTFPGVYMELECDNDLSRLDLKLAIE